MNRQVRVTWRTFCTIAHSLMVHDRLFKSVYSFCINVYNRSYIYSSTNQRYDYQRQPNNHSIYTCDSYKTFSIIFMYNILTMHWIESYCILWQKVLNMRHPAQKGFRGIFNGIPQHKKGYLVYVSIITKIISLYDVVFDESFSSSLAYTWQPYSEVMAMRPGVSYTLYATCLIFAEEVIDKLDML